MASLTWTTTIIKIHRAGTPKSGGIAPLPYWKGGSTGVEMPFHESAICNFMAYQDRIQTNLLQLFTYPGNSEWFSIISVIICEVNIVVKQK